MTPDAPGERFDPISLEIRWQRLISVMTEVDDVIVKAIFSTILSEGRDFACLLSDTQGRSLCQSVWSTATFSAVYPRTAKKLLERFPLETLRPGGAAATNDPWLGTGHLPDYVLLAPVFANGRIVACIGTVSHMSDVGGHPGEIESADVVELELAGVGGFGPPEQREPERIRHDLRHGYLTPAAAHEKHASDPDVDPAD